jgi:hypothetical protein
VGVLSFAKVLGLLYGCLGLLFAPFFFLLGMVGAFAREGRGPFAGFGMVFAIFLPIIYGFCGFLLGALMAWLYNLLASWIGGIELELGSATPAVGIPPLPRAGPV